MDYPQINCDKTMTKLRLRDKPIPAGLGTNMHIYGHPHPRFDFIKENIQVPKVLDVASGEGAFSLYCAEHFNCIVTAVDILPLKKPIAHPNVSFIEGDIMNTFFGKNSFNTILLMEIIEHLIEPKLMIYNIIRWLAPGGNLLITTPWVDTWDNQSDHVWRFDVEGVRDLIKDISRTNISLWNDDTFVYAVINRWLDVPQKEYGEFYETT